MSAKYIHKDIAFSILSKLPLKSLKRFTCVQKSWCLLFENPYFMNMLRKDFLSKHQSLYDDTCFILSQSQPWIPEYDTIYMFPNERFDSEDRVQLNWPEPLKKPSVQIVGTFSVNGTLCIHDYSTIVLWNPTTDQYKALPRTIQSYENDEYFCLYRPDGFFYDSMQDNYKVISACVQTRNQIDNKYPRFWVIYSTKCNSWRILEGDNLPYPWLRNYAINLNEMCHWLEPDSNMEFNNEIFIRNMVSFDFNNEIFIRTDLPSELEILDESKFISHLMVLNGSIAYMREYDITASFHIWILGKVGIKKSWTKLFVAGPINRVPYHPILSWNNGHMFFINKGSKLLLFDLNTQEVREIDAKGGTVHSIIYKKNLKPLDWGNE